MAKSILNHAEINLLLNSEEPKNVELYGNLYSALSDLEKVKAISLGELPMLDSKAQNTLLNNKKYLIDNSIREWRATTTIIEKPQRDVTCELCNTKIKYLCHIFNYKNNIELRVGSECIKKFPNMDGYVEHSKQLKAIHQGHKIVKRRNEFYNAFPDCEIFISNADKYFNTLPILLAYELYTKLQDTIIRMRLIYTEYVNKGKKPFKSEMDSFELFQLAINQYNKLKAEADIFVNKNMNTPLVCKRSEIDWLISQNKINLLQQISKNDGVYTLSTLKNMCSVSFIQKYINLIMTKNHSKIIKFEKFNNNGLIFSFNKLGYQSPILFVAHLKDFMQHIGANCIFNDSFTYNSKDILPILNIIESKRNLVSILGYIDDMMNLLNYTFLVDDTSESLYLYRKGDRAIRLFTSSSFMRSYSKYILHSDEYIKNYLYKIIKGNNSIKWVTPEIQAKQGIDDKIGMLYKSYKDSHEYNTRPTGKKFELMLYGIGNNSITNTVKIDFNSSEYITLQRNKLKIGDTQLRSVDYGLHVNDDSLKPFYHKGDILFIQSIQKIRNKATIFFASNSGIIIKKYYSQNEEAESIFNFTDIPKKELIAYGKVIYCLHNKSEINHVTKFQQETIPEEVKIFVTDNPRYCVKCSSKCTYKLINYIQEHKKNRKINVAVCPKCNKYYIDKNSYITYKKSKQETNIMFKLYE